MTLCILEAELSDDTAADKDCVAAQRGATAAARWSSVGHSVQMAKPTGVKYLDIFALKIKIVSYN